MPSNLGTAPVHRSEASVQSGSSGRTIRPMPPTALHQRTLSTELTPDEHLEIGIQTHSSGNLNKSTYHLRLAARAGLPTAMLLYALACRHGWGMRPNQEEGVSWLRRAIESSGLEFGAVEATVNTTTDPASSSSSSATEAQERQNRRAQFALAIYELGISYMNGWGCSKDKHLALRCYEVAASWGDCDALAEAGFCYTQGMGCKKDLKKAAALYRKAAEAGMSMAGNSWIYKAKYVEGAPSLEELGRGGLGTGSGNGAGGKGKSPEKVRHLQQQQHGSMQRREESPGLDARLRDPKERPTQRARGRSIWGRKKEKA
ncbi:HCP-like protein [Hortaea werneckii]|nr:HCP-like protein [Hortaea werneckii]